MKMRSIALLLVVASCVAAAPGFASTAALFAPIAARLSKSAVPVLVPSRIQKEDLEGLHAELRSAGATGYEIELAYAPGCNGATVCHLGTLSGRRSDGSKIAGKPARLPLGVTAYYAAGPCGASCSDATMTFDYRHNRYVLAAKGVSFAYLSAWASAIEPLSSLKPRR